MGSKNKDIEIVNSLNSKSKVHGYVSSCVGPVVDVSMKNKQNHLRKIAKIYDTLSIVSKRENPCIYDSLLLVRQTCNFREGLSLENSIKTKMGWYEALQREERLLLGFCSLIHIDYSQNSNYIKTNIKRENKSIKSKEVGTGLESLSTI